MSTNCGKLSTKFDISTKNTSIKNFDKNLPASRDSAIFDARDASNRRRHKFKFCHVDIRQILNNFRHLRTLDGDQTSILLKFQSHVQALTENRISIRFRK